MTGTPRDSIQITGAGGITDILSADGLTLTVSTSNGPAGTILFTSPVTAAFANALVQCFAAGTSIETANGPAAVEALSAGDEVKTLLGGNGRIVWAGARTVDCARHSCPETVWPVRIEKAAFGPNIPARAVLLSPDHAVFVDGVLIPVKFLINQTTIRQIKKSAITYHHLELERHDVVLADGLPAETWLNVGAKPGAIANPGEGANARLWELAGCAARVQSGPILASVRAKLAHMDWLGDWLEDCLGQPETIRKPIRAAA